MGGRYVSQHPASFYAVRCDTWYEDDTRAPSCSPYLGCFDKGRIGAANGFEQRLTVERDVARYVDKPHDGGVLALDPTRDWIKVLGRGAAHDAAVRVRQQHDVPLLLVQEGKEDVVAERGDVARAAGRRRIHRVATGVWPRMRSNPNPLQKGQERVKPGGSTECARNEDEDWAD